MTLDDLVSVCTSLSANKHNICIQKFITRNIVKHVARIRGAENFTLSELNASELVKIDLNSSSGSIAMVAYSMEKVDVNSRIECVRIWKFHPCIL